MASQRSLDNAGERLHLVDAAGETMVDFDYEDDWQPATDGDDQNDRDEAMAGSDPSTATSRFETLAATLMLDGSMHLEFPATAHRGYRVGSGLRPTSTGTASLLPGGSGRPNSGKPDSSN